MKIRIFDPDHDIHPVLALWQLAFADDQQNTGWPVTLEWFQAVALPTGSGRDHLVAEVDGQLVGFVLAQGNPANPAKGSLQALAVHPHHRRQGIGRALVKAAVDRLCARGVQQVYLGSGGAGYFWPGVPVSLPGAWPFSQALGWLETERSFDLVRSLDDYRTPAWVWDRVRPLGLEFALASDIQNDDAILELVAAEQPAWKPYFASAFRAGRRHDVLAAWRPEAQAVAGACLLEVDAPRWSLRMASPVGAPACILTAQSAQGQGIGMALSARATEICQERGCRTAFLGWTWLVDWYGKLGYSVWQEYVMSWKAIGAVHL